MRSAPIIVLLGVAFAASACSSESALERRSDSSAKTSPTTDHQREGVCHPFPDRQIDDFIAAYNDRDLDALEAMVDAEPIDDVVGAAYAGRSTFADVAEWAEASWEADDRMDLTGYTAFYPTKRGFQMHMARRGAELRSYGIDAVSTTLDAISRGCSIASLEMSGIVQAKGEPCAFYDAFGGIDDVATNEPTACRDGSGNHARVGHTAVWTGDQVLVWGGKRGGNFTYGDVALDGLSFDPASDRWRRIPQPSLPPFYPEVSAWTGQELIVFGGKARGRGIVGAAYDPFLGSWRIIEFPYGGYWSGFEAVWTGTELVLWGGPDHSVRPRRRGAVYDPASDTWRRTSPAPVGARWWHALAWTGTEMIVWGGTDASTDLADGAAYDPVTDSWRTIAPAPLSPRQWLPIVWTGREVIVWGGSSYSTSQADGAAYDPVADSWRKLAPAPLSGRHYHSVTWTGSEVIVFGGYNYRRTFRGGAAYDPASDSWREITPPPVASRCCHSALWTDGEMFVFGGSHHELGGMALGDGALYDPTTDHWRRVIPSPDSGR